MGKYTIVRPMTHGGVPCRTTHAPWGGCPVVRSMTLGKLIPHGSWVVQCIVRCCMAHDPWNFVTLVWSMTHGKKVAEGAPALPQSLGMSQAVVQSGGSPVALQRGVVPAVVRVIAHQDMEEPGMGGNLEVLAPLPPDTDDPEVLHRPDGAP